MDVDDVTAFYVRGPAYAANVAANADYGLAGNPAHASAGAVGAGRAGLSILSILVLAGAFFYVATRAHQH